MRSKQANPGYILPMALAPTQMQILTPHGEVLLVALPLCRGRSDVLVY